MKITFGLYPWTSSSEVLCPIVTLFLHRNGPLTAAANMDRQKNRQALVLDTMFKCGKTHMHITSYCSRSICHMMCSGVNFDGRVAGRGGRSWTMIPVTESRCLEREV